MEVKSLQLGKNAIYASFKRHVYEMQETMNLAFRLFYGEVQF